MTESKETEFLSKNVSDSGKLLFIKRDLGIYFDGSFCSVIESFFDI